MRWTTYSATVFGNPFLALKRVLNREYSIIRLVVNDFKSIVQNILISVDPQRFRNQDRIKSNVFHIIRSNRFGEGIDNILTNF